MRLHAAFMRARGRCGHRHVHGWTPHALAALGIRVSSHHALRPRNPFPIRTPTVWRLAWRQLARDFRAGELRLLVVAVMLAVAALTAVGFFADRINNGLARDARQMLGGDAIVASDQPATAAFTEQAAPAGPAHGATTIVPEHGPRAGRKGRCDAPGHGQGRQRGLPAARACSRLAEAPGGAEMRWPARRSAARCGSTLRCPRRSASRWATRCCWVMPAAHRPADRRRARSRRGLHGLLAAGACSTRRTCPPPVWSSRPAA